MEYTKRFSVILILLLFTFSLSIVFSQDKNEYSEIRAKKIADKMQTKLNLSQDQYSQVFKSYQEYFTNVKTAKENKLESYVNSKTLIKGYKNQLKTSLKNTLNFEQYAKFKKMHKVKKFKTIKK